MTPVSFVIPVRNAGPSLLLTVRSIAREARGVDHEIVLVDDGSADGAIDAVLREHASAPLTLVRGDGAGAAAALNRGFAAARHAVVCQVDQDVVLAPGWLPSLLAHLDSDDVAAVQGQYVTDPEASLLARVMGRDLEERYAALGADTGHACTGNVVYRAAAVRAVGGFDESMGYGYDNDMSYRLRAAGYRLRYCPEARSTHGWREGLLGYARQQYGFGYGRLDLVAKHHDRVTGDSVSPAMMMLHPPLTALACLCLGVGMLVDVHRGWFFGAAAGVFAFLILERTLVGMRAAVRFRDWVPLLFPPVHLVRNLAWVCAIATWSLRRLAGRRSVPAHSMRPRQAPQPEVSHARPAADSATVSGGGLTGSAERPSLHAQRPSGAVGHATAGPAVRA